MATDAIRVGDLRWPLWLVTRVQTADPSGTDIIETATNGRLVHAAVEPITALEVWNGTREAPYQTTHIITTRWLDYIDNTRAFVRQTVRPTDGATRTEVFRVQRVTEVGGRKRFSRCECRVEDFGWCATMTGSAVPGATIPTLDSNGNAPNTGALLP